MKIQGSPIRIYAIVSQLQEKDLWNVVGLSSPGGHFPCVSSSKDVIESAYRLISQEAKDKGAKIILLVETEEKQAD